MRLGTENSRPAHLTSIVEGTSWYETSPNIDSSSARLPSGLCVLLAHEQQLRRHAGGTVGLIVAAALDVRDRRVEALPAVEVVLVGGEPREEAVCALHLALGLGRPRRAQHDLEPRLAGEPLDPVNASDVAPEFSVHKSEIGTGTIVCMAQDTLPVSERAGAFPVWAI